MEVAGLVFGVLSTLELCLKFTSETESLVRRYRTVESDFEWANQRLRFHRTNFNTWVQFWNIKQDTSQKSFYVLWGEDGTTTIQDHLKGIKNMCEKANQSQAQYKRDFEAGRSSFTKLHGKLYFSFSGRKELEEHLDNLRSEFSLVTKEAKRFFEARNPTVPRGSISKEVICGIVRESGTMDPDRALLVQKTSKELFYGLEVTKLCLNLDIALQPDYISKRQFQNLQLDSRKLDEDSVKLPVVVNNAFAREKSASKISPPSVFVFEAGEKNSFEALVKNKSRPNPYGVDLSTPFLIKDFCDIAMLRAKRPTREDDTDQTESFILKFSRNERCDIYQFLVHSCSTDFSGSQISSSNPTSLERLFDRIPQRTYQPPSRIFPITWQFDLVYTLALSVLNLQGSGWLDGLRSGNIYQRDMQHSVKVCGNDIPIPEETALEIFFHSARRRGYHVPEVFRLGILMLEIALGRSISSISEGNTIKEFPNRLFCDLECSVGPAYVEVTIICLAGEFKVDYDNTTTSFIRSYIKTVLEPSKIQCEAMCVNQSRDESNWSARFLEMNGRKKPRGYRGKHVTLHPLTETLSWDR